MEPRISDEVFGHLEFNDSYGSWVRETELTFLGRSANVELIVEGNGEDESIHDEQRVSFQALPESIAKAEDAVFDFYQCVCDEYREQFGEEADNRVPRISERSELSTLVRLTGVVFPMVMDPGEHSVGFLLECTWEPEHGLGVKVCNGEVEVGNQDIVT